VAVDDWYGIGVSLGLGVALGVLLVALLASLRLGPVISVVLAVAGAVAAGWWVSGWSGLAGGVVGALLGVLGAALIARGALGRGGTAGGTGFILVSAGVALAGLAWVPLAGYVTAVAVPVLGVRARRRAPERHAGLRTLAK
jgi:hypothetical protein